MIGEIETATDYSDFLTSKVSHGADHGFAPTFVPEYLFDFQRALLTWAVEKGRAAIFADCGLGKGQPEGARILTTSGFVSNTDVQVGDMVVGADGNSYPLIAKYERGVRPIYRVHFSDKSSFTVDGDHLHIVRTNNDRQRRRPWRVLSTNELINVTMRYGKDGKSRNLDIPVVKPVQGPHRNHWLHPYILGVLLGDGCLRIGCKVTLADAQIVDTVRSLLPAGWTIRMRGARKIDYVISKNGMNDRVMVKELRRLGLYGCKSKDKFIPGEYLDDSVENRVWLLRGLMDTDGYAGNGTSQFYTTSSRLADDTLHLIRSLGGVPTRSKKSPSYRYKGVLLPGLPCHVLTFSLITFNPFHLSRKAIKWNPAPRDNGRWIDRIEPCGEALTICLSVGSPDQSYVTEHFIVTHNTPIQLAWAENIIRKTGKPVLILTPLAVSAQTIEEAHKFDIAAIRSAGELPDKPGIVVTNYEKLHHFRASDFIGVVCDESSILKSFDGVRRGEITAFMRAVPYRLLCTATAAPNDYTELGTSSEALGYLGHIDMLNRFFVNDMKNSATGRQHGKSATWRMKGHAESSYWRWVTSWARAVRKPSDLGFENGAFELPPLTEREHIVTAKALANGQLFALPALDLYAQREERKRTIRERCETAAALVSDTGRPALLWCDLNEEGNLLEKLIPDAVQVSGSDSDDDKEDRLLGFAQGRYRVLVTKKRIGAWGLNFQNCAHEVYFPSHSYEQYYQAVRRCWRFGQKQSVIVDCVMTEGERAVMHNLQAKASAADAMFSNLVACMNDEMHIGASAPFHSEEEIPTWL